jgi:hypothetical protein
MSNKKLTNPPRIFGSDSPPDELGFARLFLNVEAGQMPKAPPTRPVCKVAGRVAPPAAWMIFES